MPCKWFEIGEGWTDALRAKCLSMCEGDRPCWLLGGQGMIGGEIEYITPCDDCIKSAQLSETAGKGE